MGGVARDRLPAVEIAPRSLVLGADRVVTEVVLTEPVAQVVLAWRAHRVALASAPFAAIVREVARELDPIAAG